MTFLYFCTSHKQACSKNKHHLLEIRIHVYFTVNICDSISGKIDILFHPNVSDVFLFVSACSSVQHTQEEGLRGKDAGISELTNSEI